LTSTNSNTSDSPIPRPDLFELLFESGPMSEFSEWCLENSERHGRKRIVFPTATAKDDRFHHLHVFFAKVIAYILWCGFAVTVYLENPLRKSRDMLVKNEQFYRRIANSELEMINRSERDKKRKIEDIRQVEWPLEFVDEDQCARRIDLHTHCDLERSLYSNLLLSNVTKAVKEAMRPRIESGYYATGSQSEAEAAAKADELYTAYSAFQVAMVCCSKGPLKETVAILCGKDRLTLIDLCREALATSGTVSPPPLLMRSVTDLNGQQRFNDARVVARIWPDPDEQMLDRSLREMAETRPWKEVLDFAKLYLPPTHPVLVKVQGASSESTDRLAKELAVALSSTFMSYANTTFEMKSDVAQPTIWVSDIDRILAIAKTLSGSRLKLRTYAAILKLDENGRRDQAINARLAKFLGVKESSVTGIMTDRAGLVPAGLVAETRRGEKKKKSKPYYPCAKDTIIMALDLHSFADKYVTDENLRFFTSNPAQLFTQNHARTRQATA